MVNYLAQGLSEEERSVYAQPFVDLLSSPEGQKSIEEDDGRKKQVIALVLKQVRGVGEGTEKGTSHSSLDDISLKPFLRRNRGILQPLVRTSTHAFLS